MIEWNVVCFHCMINNYASMHVFFIPLHYTFLLYMFMGLSFSGLIAKSYVSRVLSVVLRGGDVTDWFQSIQVAAVGLYGPRKSVNRGGDNLC